MRRTRNMNYRSKSIWLKARKHSLARSARISLTALPVFDHLSATLSGEHHRFHCIPVRIVRHLISLSRVTSNDMCTVAPNTQAFSVGDLEDPLRVDGTQPDVVPMTGLQIAMSREIGGWPLYTIVIAAGQVCTQFTRIMDSVPDYNLDVECDEFPDHPTKWSKLAR
jgi:hypothetical protein